MTAYSAFPVHAAPGAEPKPATAATQAYLEQFSASLPFADREDFELATRGFVAAVPGNRILDAEGNLLRDLNCGRVLCATRTPHGKSESMPKCRVGGEIGALQGF